MSETELFITTNDLNEWFDVDNKKIIKLLNHHNIVKKEKYYTSTKFHYTWNIIELNEDVFSELNSKENFKNKEEFIFYYQNRKDPLLMEQLLQLQKERAKNILKVRTQILDDVFKIGSILSTVQKLKNHSVRKVKDGKIIYYFLNDINEKCFLSLNKVNKCFENYEDFVLNGYRKAVELQLEENNKRETKRLKNERKRQRKMEDEKNKIELETIGREKVSELIDDYYKKFWFDKRLEGTKYIIHVGPTNSGKTYQAINRLIEIGNEGGNGVYLAPLRLLAHEVYEKLSQQLSPEKTELVTGEHIIENEGGNENNIISSRTVEMMDDNKYFDVVVIDECFMLCDPQRGAAWMKAIVSSKSGEVHLISSLESLFIIKNLLEKLNRKYEINNYERKTPLIMSQNHYDINKVLDKSVFITFSRANVLLQKYLFEKRGHNVSVIYGNLPPEVKNEQIKKFVSGENNVCISTDAIGMGLNLPCDHICFLEVEKYDGTTTRHLNSIEIKQISGRAGRFGLSEKGVVYGSNKYTNKVIGEGLRKENYSINKCYVGVNFDFLKTLPQKKLVDKFLFYKKLNTIPKELENIVFLESVDKYINLSTHHSIDEIDIEYAWSLLNLPVHHEVESFWRDLVTTIKNDDIINFYPEYGEKLTIGDSTQLKEAEIFMFKLDLLIALSNDKNLSSFIYAELVKKIKSIKQIVIIKINEFILNKKLSSVKKCSSCGKNVGITWVHAKCDNCFRKERNKYYYNNNYTLLIK